LILPVAIFLTGRYRREAEGLVFGAASGMAFAALETMGYGFVALVESHGDVGVAEDTLIIEASWPQLGTERGRLRRAACSGGKES
jgi:RsiW-degrading membrane proteinase PrsW (M82 family)